MSASAFMTTMLLHMTDQSKHGVLCCSPSVHGQLVVNFTIAELRNTVFVARVSGIHSLMAAANVIHRKRTVSFWKNTGV
jgi:hypothetical protein